MINLTIEIPDTLAAALSEKASAEGVSDSICARQILEHVLCQQPAPQAKPKKSAYGLLENYGPGPSAEVINENRREMFRSFAEDAS
jgi:hypothetical protein